MAALSAKNPHRPAAGKGRKAKRWITLMYKCNRQCVDG